jgi:geranylgeranyl pyrophosphate synthase
VPIQNTHTNAMAQQDRRERLKLFWEDCRSRIDAELERSLPVAEGDQARLHAAMRHAVLGGGKRLRPTLAVVAYDSLGGGDRVIYTAGAALEMLHCYSLVHDDLPCMDDDDQRRGRPTVHVAFDDATAVLAGDALHALAFELLAQCAPATVVASIATAVGPQGMVGGQVADLEAEGNDATEELVAAIHRRKTGALIVASVRAGGVIAGASGATLDQLERYAHPLGLAFQIVDDILELTQSAEVLGKPIGSDLKHQKVTYPGAVGLENSRAKASSLIVEAKQALGQYQGDPNLLLALADFVIERDR